MKLRLIKQTYREFGVLTQRTLIEIDGKVFIPNWTGTIWGWRDLSGYGRKYTYLRRITRVLGKDYMESDSGKRLLPLQLRDGEQVHPWGWNLGKAFLLDDKCAPGEM